MPRKDPIARAAYNKEYNARNAEARSLVEKIRYHEKGGKETQQDYRQDRLPQYAEYQRKSREQHPHQHMVTDARSRAKRYGVPRTITVEDIEWVTHCPVFGIELVYGRTGGAGGRPNSATLDRKVNALGYIPGNVFVISHRANRLKQDATVEELEALIRYMKS